ncbi:MAG: hypothetical protein ABIQ39_12045, partial [Ilumatobacteraceae bacterium]
GATHPSFVDDLTDTDGHRALPGDGTGSFEHAWLVTDATSLFDYDAGQSTTTFQHGVLPPPPPPAPTAETTKTCTNGLGDGATRFEVQSCAFDATAAGNTSPFVDAYRQITAARLATHVADLASVPAASTDKTSDSIPNNSSAPIPAVAGAPVLTLSGPIILSGSFGSDTKDALDGSIELPADTVVLARATCPKDPGFDLSLQLTSRTTGASSTVGLCGNLWQLETYDAAPGEANEGEGYLLVRDGGTFDVHVTTGSQTAEYTSVQVYADPTPTIVKPDDLPAGHDTTITMSGVGDTVIVDLKPGSGGTWTITGADQVCSKEYYIAGTDGTGTDDLGGDCTHHANLEIGPAEGMLPLVLIDRTGATVHVTVARTG